MATQSWEVLWSPHHSDKFIRYNNDICLYKVLKGQDSDSTASGAKPQVIKLADDTFASVAALNSDVSSIKVVSWCLKPETENLLAVGQSNGHVVLTSIGHESNQNTRSLVGRELVPKSDRTCTDLAWNPSEHNLLAVGLDKVRNDYSLLVWDVEARATPSTPNAYFSRQYSYEQPVFYTPMFRDGLSESTVSLAWFPHQPKTLIAGQGQKFLRIYDIRDQGRPLNFAVTNVKAMSGVCIDPFNENRVASYAEVTQGPVLVWDTRNFKEPYLTINQANQTKSISKIAWCPTRAHMLAVLYKNSPVIRLYDLQHTQVGVSPMPYAAGSEDELESMIKERTVQPSKMTVSSFSWHPTTDKSMLTASTTGYLHYLKIFERIALSWSSNAGIVWGCGRHMLSCTEKDDDAGKEIHDISTLMKERALRGYGEKTVMKDFNRLKEILGDPQLIKLWNWIKHVRRPKDQDTKKGRKFYGVKSIIKGEMNMAAYKLRMKAKMRRKSGDKCEKGVADEGSRDSSPLKSIPSYVSEDRKLALQLCGWNFNSGLLRDHLERLEYCGECERAAAMALFNNEMRLAINILSGRHMRAEKSDNGPRAQQGDPSLKVVAMALAGYSEEKKSLWREMCSSLSSQLRNPYLRAAFAFLTEDEEDFHGVLKETGMELQDRVAFACKYLSDSKLASYIENITTTMIDDGNLEGLLLTGLTADGLTLLERYVTKTSDVQTASLVIVNAKVVDALKDSRVVCWLDRAKLDAFVYSAETGRKVPNQICVSCNFCGKAVSSNFLTSGVSRPHRYPGGPSSKPKVMSCPYCRRPLPRCAVCLIYMGTSSTHIHRQNSKSRPNRRNNPFDNWFTWCQSCRHGGHAVHLIEWFREETECPVTGCTCRCNVQDGVSQISAESSGSSLDYTLHESR